MSFIRYRTRLTGLFFFILIFSLMIHISAVIITFNEQDNIGRCIDSVQGVADEVLVVDSGSTDATYRIATEKGARVISHAWEGYSAQKNFANGEAKNCGKR